MALEKLPMAIDLSHHLSEVARARGTSPLKGLQKYWGKPGLLSLAGGLPHPDYFPFVSIGGEILEADSFPATRPGPTKVMTQPISTPKYTENPKDLNLSTTLQYSMATGIAPLQNFVEDFTSKVFRPAYSDFVSLVNTGNTDGWFKCVTTFCNPGEGVLMSEWTYTSAIATMLPNGIKPVPVPMDSQGMTSDGLRQVLSQWDSEARGMKRPHVLYAVPTGQNPTGATTGESRKREIYALCVEYDVIIVDDDPYFFLQQGPYVPKARRQPQAIVEGEETESYISKLAPSFLKFDYQGRVIRLDSFSKTLAPGCRLGWFTCNPIFAERLERQAEVSTQAPCGFAQTLVTTLLQTWKFEGYIRWLQGLAIEYAYRRDCIVDCLAEEFHLEYSSDGKGCEVYTAFPKRRGTVLQKLIPAMFSFVPPTSGMFLWIKLYPENFSPPEDGRLLEDHLWDELAEAGVLIAPGQLFAAGAGQQDARQAHLRISFSNSEPDDLRKAVAIVRKVLEKEFMQLQ